MPWIVDWRQCLQDYEETEDVDEGGGSEADDGGGGDDGDPSTSHSDNNRGGGGNGILETAVQNGEFRKIISRLLNLNDL